MPITKTTLNSRRSNKWVHNSSPLNRSVDELMMGYSELFDRTVLKWIDWKVPQGVLSSGDVTSGTINSLTDSTANWGENQWKDKICKIWKNGGTDFQFGIVLGNNSTTLIFDDNLIAAPCNECSYEIIHSLIVLHEDLSCVIAIDATEGKGGVILPKSIPNTERLFVYAYMERGNIFEDSEVPIMCRDTDRQAGAKYGTLMERSEAVSLYAHQWISSHYDILGTYNIVRLGAAYWNNDVSIVNNNVFEYITPTAAITSDIHKRIVPHEFEGNIWWRYTSLIPKYFILTFNANIAKTGGVGDLEIIWRLRYPDGAIEDLDTIRARTRFGSGIGEDAISVSVPVRLERNYEITPVAAKSGGTFSIELGSSVLIREI